MLGLRTQEEQNFKDFFSFVQSAAGKLGCIFFLDTGEGNEKNINGIETMNLSGWLVPLEKAEEFEKIWKEEKENDDWVDFFKFASVVNDNMEIVFE